VSALGEDLFDFDLDFEVVLDNLGVRTVIALGSSMSVK
jgi:hypothetical protein